MDIHIRRATAGDWRAIVDIGTVSVRDAHQASCSKADMDHYINGHYNEAAITNELNEAANIYHLIFYKGEPVGFSKMVLDAVHTNIVQERTTKLDRIYLLKDFYGLKLGAHLLNHNIAFSRENGQQGMWLFTWTGNERAIAFYLKGGFTIVGTHQFKVSETHYNPNHHMFLVY